MPYGRGPAWVPGPSRPAGGWYGLIRQWTRRVGYPAPSAAGGPRPARRYWTSPVSSAVLDATGAATLVLAPAGGETWWPAAAIIACTSFPQYQVYCQVWRGGANGTPVALLSSSYQAAQDTLGLPRRPVVQGDALIAIFSAGQPGATVTVAYEGEHDIA